MTPPATFVSRLVAGLFNGPIASVLDVYVNDIDVRRKLAAELERQTLDYFTRSAELNAPAVLAEIQSEHWLTRSWRPVLMMILMGFLILAGIVLPLADLLLGYHLPFDPRWQLLPSGFWDFLSIGMGGYIGGRSLEKVAGLIAPKPGSRVNK